VTETPATEQILAASALLHHYRTLCSLAGEVAADPYSCAIANDSPEPWEAYAVLRWRAFSLAVVARCYSIGHYVVDGVSCADASSAAVALSGAIAAAEERVRRGETQNARPR
jgi:hypothetical protein